MTEHHEESLREQYKEEVHGLVQKAGKLLRSRYGVWFLGVLTFADTALGLPLVMDPFLVAYIISNKKRAWLGYVVMVAASVLGGIFAYFFTSYLIQSLFGFLTPGLTHALHVASREVNRGAFIFSFLSSAAPVSYTLVAVAAGVLHVNLFAVIAGSIIGRTFRYGIIALPTYYWGEKMIPVFKRHALIIFGIITAVVILHILFT